MDKEQQAIERLKLAAMMSETYYHKPVLICYSGGKDSDVLLELAQRSGIRYEVEHSLTTVDAPETVYHVRDKFRQLEEAGVSCRIKHPEMTMWQLIVHRKILPTRRIRYCCAELKETNGDGRHIVTGVRWAESTRRRNTRGVQESFEDKDKKIILTNDNDDKRLLTERCQMRAKTITNPIIDWEDSDIYSYIDQEHICINPLYCQGFPRVGCIGCPMAGRRARELEFERYPTYKKAYITAIGKMIKAREAAGLKPFAPRTAQGMFDWWMETGILDGQLKLEMDQDE
nr:MAG TPA: phosphoadenosine-phosphosulfate reductase [Caudoviricetes sp.]